MVVATGGLSIPKIGATPFGYKIAQQFGIPVTKLKPGLVPLSFHPEEWVDYTALAGVSVDAIVSYGKQTFRENLLMTHRGLSGPVILQISSYWEHGQPLHINLLPDHDMRSVFTGQRGNTMLINNFLAQYLPRRFIEVWFKQLVASGILCRLRMDKCRGRRMRGSDQGAVMNLPRILEKRRSTWLIRLVLNGLAQAGGSGSDYRFARQVRFRSYHHS